MNKLILIMVLLMVGCATTGTDGFVPLGANKYMIGRLGKFNDFSGSAVKARLFQEATVFCAEKGLDIRLDNSVAKDSEYANYASAEIQFSCIPFTKN